MKKFSIALLFIGVLFGVGMLFTATNNPVLAESLIGEDPPINDDTPIGEDPPINDPEPPTSVGSLENPLKTNSITGLFNIILDIILIFAIPIIVFFIIYAGFLFVTARGNEETLTKAKRALLYALLGGVLILGARALLAIIEGTVARF